MRMRALPCHIKDVFSPPETTETTDMSSRLRHFRGIGQYAKQLMDFAEGRPMFTGRGQKLFNKEVLTAIIAIMKCRQGSFFTPSASKPCLCGWHTKAAPRKRGRHTQTLLHRHPQRLRHYVM